ncbi:MAG TPA: hypothetical protein PLC42_06065 [Parachlamydiaceae bacterium]|nr:hypothetical protein [Parachlamydiaceae bacterium]
MQGNEHKIVLAGLIVGSLGTAGLFVAGTKLMKHANASKKEAASKTTSPSTPKTAKTASEVPTPEAAEAPKTSSITVEDILKTAPKELRSFEQNNLAFREQQIKSEIQNTQKELKSFPALKHEAEEALSQIQGEKAKDSFYSISYNFAKISQGEELENIAKVKEENKGVQGFEKLINDYEKIATKKGAEKFVEDNKKNLLFKPLENIHKSYKNIENLENEMKELQPQIEKFNEEQQLIQNEINAADANLKAIKNKEAETEFKLKELNSRLEDVGIQKNINQMLEDGKDIGNDQLITVLKSQIERETRYMIAVDPKDSNKIALKEKTIAALEGKLEDLESKQAVKKSTAVEPEAKIEEPGEDVKLETKSDPEEDVKLETKPDNEQEISNMAKQETEPAIDAKQDIDQTGSAEKTEEPEINLDDFFKNFTEEIDNIKNI